jgi:hypothetical protein
MRSFLRVVVKVFSKGPRLTRTDTKINFQKFLDAQFFSLSVVQWPRRDFKKSPDWRNTSKCQPFRCWDRYNLAACTYVVY